MRATLVQGLPEADLEALKQEAAVGFTQRFDFQFAGFEIPSDADRMLVRMPLSMVSLVRDQVRFTKRPKKT